MSAVAAYYGDQDFAYRVREFPSERVPRPSRVRRSKHLARRRGKAPAQYGVMQRRRRKRISW